VLSWLLGEAAASRVRQLLKDADVVVSSDLTLVECDRVLHRASTLGLLGETHAIDLRALLAAAARHWNVLRITQPIVERARQPFPGEPIRTLDALHVASALHARITVPDLALVSLDERIRKVGRGLGLDVVPA
jgi:predicted nucleic acid-binding protein